MVYIPPPPPIPGTPPDVTTGFNWATVWVLLALLIILGGALLWDKWNAKRNKK